MADLKPPKRREQSELLPRFRVLVMERGMPTNRLPLTYRAYDVAGAASDAEVLLYAQKAHPDDHVKVRAVAPEYSANMPAPMKELMRHRYDTMKSEASR